MSVDALLQRIEAARALGALVLLKWDGERTNKVCTVVITHTGLDFVVRRDTDDLANSLSEVLDEFESCRSGGISSSRAAF
jgi:hypothetical protein